MVLIDTVKKIQLGKLSKYKPEFRCDLNEKCNDPDLHYSKRIL